jgi:hypothetical protein
VADAGAAVETGTVIGPDAAQVDADADAGAGPDEAEGGR